MNRRQRFSLRKYKFGLASVLLGTALVFGASQVSANEQSTGENQAQTQEIKTELKDDKHSNSSTDQTNTNGIAPVVGEKQEVETSKEDASKQDAKVEAPVDKTAEAQESGKDSAVAKEENQGVVQKETTVDTSTAPATEKASTIEKKRLKQRQLLKLLEKQQLLKKNKKKLSLQNPIVFQAMISSQYRKLGRLVTRGQGPLLPLLTQGLI